MILVVEDEPADVALLQLAFEQCSQWPSVDIVSNGEQALSWLRSNVAGPEWVLLDLNLPRMGGKEVLRELRKDPRLEALPVVVFSSSANLQDVTECYELGANCYVEKPYEFAKLVKLLESLARFWRNAGRGETQAACAGGHLAP
jgi:two-component system, chemotaxis family, response regulator Rcp1